MHDQSGHIPSSSPRLAEPRETPPLHHLSLLMWHMCALIAMMVWSFTHQGWVTFVLLLWACRIQIGLQFLSTGIFCFPFSLFYGLVLLGHVPAPPSAPPPHPSAPQPVQLGQGWSSPTASAWT